ncbi:hypothetical protein MUK42_05493 [Musa troglodytarum]|uniref:Uncharacterized protein n=1 Tax=Musa troglodytarum TaxID=320322 RepID=A0A9E7KA12_9LILI|nr:hypothetical protein MUK42_05493 [Musa troglodytarum]
MEQTTLLRELPNLDAHKAEETKLSGSAHSNGDRSRPAVQWSSFKTATSPPLQLVRHVCSQDHVPCDEEWLREVVLVAVELMMDIVIRGVVPEEEVEDVPGKPQAAVVIYPFDGGEGEEEDGGSGRHAREKEGEAAAEGVQEKPFYRVVVLAAEGVWDDEAVVPRMDVAVQELVQVHVSVPEVLPCIENKHGDEELPQEYGTTRRWCHEWTWRYKNLFRCMYRCQKYCHVSRTNMATRNCLTSERNEAGSLVAAAL